MKKTPLALRYLAPAPKINENSPSAHTRVDCEPDIGFERWSLPLGNGYFGVSVFGRCDTERIQITEKTLQNPPTLVKDENTYFVGGLNSFSETYIDFCHTEVSDYERYLDIENAVAGVGYTYRGVGYTREYFTSYPDKALVIRLLASEEGKLDFTLRPTVPYIQSYGGYRGDGVSKTGEVRAKAVGGVGTVCLSGKLDYYGIDFLGIYKVYTDGGVIEAREYPYTYTDKDGEKKTCVNGSIRVSGAKSAVIIVTLGTDYELSEEIFSSPEDKKPTLFTTLADTEKKVSGYMADIEALISGKSIDEAYSILKERHIKDHSELFGRVSLDLGGDEDSELPTDVLIEKYRSGKRSAYLEALLTQYGRYLLIASSRKGALPANLQGAWNSYNVPAWACGYWHNINVQMNYWQAFAANLAETFEAYSDYNAAYMKTAKKYADEVVADRFPDQLDKDGGNGWVIGTDGYQFRITKDVSAGNLGFTTQLFWEQYCFTRDRAVLERVFGMLLDAARFITKCVKEDAGGNYLVCDCDSPEMHVGGIWYRTSGTAYAQAFAYMNNYNTLLAARELGIDLSDERLLSKDEYKVLKTVLLQIDKYDPVKVGLSGQVKEFREEDYYCSMGDEYHHRHISQLVGLYPATVINSNTPAWLDAALVSLRERGNMATGWGLAHRLNAGARTKKGDLAKSTLEALISGNTAPNLLNFHPPFQIDGSLGLTSGVLEMLLQSHEGYIAPLAALPSDWQRGSYTGLVARGNFEVSASWDKGVAERIKIRSRQGGISRVCYTGMENAVIKTESGRTVLFDREGDIVSFSTEAGESYVIEGFTKKERLAAPSDLKLSFGKDFPSLSWSAVGGADRYNVYAAKEDSPEYTLLGVSKREEFNLPIEYFSADLRATFAVTAASDSAIESERALCYKIPCIYSEYTVIPTSCASLPFAVFARGGKYYCGSASTLSEAIDLLEAREDGVIMLTRDSVLDMPIIPSRVPVKRLTIDLAGRSLILNSELCCNSILRRELESLTVKGGKLLVAEGSVLDISSCGSDEPCECIFSSVYFARYRYTKESMPLFTSAIHSESEAYWKVSLIDCTVDCFDVPFKGGVAVFDIKEGKGGIRIIGGEIKLKSFESPKLMRSPESLLFEGRDCRITVTSEPRSEVFFNTPFGKKPLVLAERKKIHHTVYYKYKINSPSERR
ncbi:MAG: glycoside hydrolase N-terminal domain-containing protein [Clostridia bacterium]|nr:glycoside hydrolase N-terminal domain-containing protein [Clostridia bacterium]